MSELTKAQRIAEVETKYCDDFDVEVFGVCCSSCHEDRDFFDGTFQGSPYLVCCKLSFSIEAKIKAIESEETE